MIEYSPTDSSAFSPGENFGVKVIGVGGAGANVLDRMALEGSDDAELLTLNTDVRALTTSVSSNKIQLGTTLLKGMGTGGDPSLGRQAALEAVDEIREAVRGNHMVFLCVGLGGGTGSGAAPEVCRIAKEEGVFLVVFATMPFSFEGERRRGQAIDALEAIGRYANAVITFDNDRMGELIVPKDGVTQAFAAADKIISQSIRATMNVVFRPGIIRIGMDDLLAALDSDDSRCLFGYGVAKGDNRSHEAVEQAMKCPLLDRGKLLTDTKAVLVQVAGGDSMTLYEVQLVMEEIGKHVGPDTQILFGTGTDQRLSNSLSVTIISSTPGPDAGKRSRDDDDEGVAGTPAVSLGLAGASAAPSLSAPEPPVSPLSFAEEDEVLSLGDPEPPKLAASVESVPPLEEDDVFSENFDEEEPAVYESIDDDPEERPSYSLDPIEEEERNPIARAVEKAQAGPIEEEYSDEEQTLPISPVAARVASDEGAGRVEAETGEQKITLTRMVSSGNTGRIKTRSPEEAEAAGPVLPPTKPPAMPAESLEPSEEARQQQEMLQLEPAAGKGRFAKTDPTIVDGEDLDVPTFLRKKK